MNPCLYEDMVGVLNLYEATYHSFEDESILDEARDFTTKYLQENQEKIIDGRLSALVGHALELPLHWRVPRVEAKWFIGVYEETSGFNPTIVELAKLDFNIVQAIHLDDLKHASRWWNKTSWDKKLSFARDRLVENFLWTVGVNYLPQFSLGRRTLAKVNAMVTTIDDWEDLCKSYLLEAQWYHAGHTPTLEEYLDNACVSISIPLILTHVKFLTSDSLTEEILQYKERADNIVRYSSLIFRLADDLGTSLDEMARGDIPKSIQCYMHESGASEDDARMYIKTLIRDTWKKLNKEREGADSKFAREFNECATNLARMAQFMYGEGDGHGRPHVTKSHVLSLLINPIQMVK
ncbi:R-linalool synthase QH1, chloroplastic-like protein isoform X2 [Tanacetum coccineum]